MSRAFPGNRLVRAPLCRAILLALCAVVFLLRGPVRALDETVNMDAPLLLMASAVWNQGGNPYDTAELAAVVGKDAGPAERATLQRGPQAFVYSPPVYALLSPLTYLPWPMQRLAWNLLNVIFLIASLVLICRLFDLPIRSLDGCAVLAIGLATNPSHICVALGQTGLVLLFLITASWCIVPAEEQPQSWVRILVAGLMAGVAAVIKPQILLVYLALDLYVGRWRVAVVTAALALFIVAAVVAVHGNSGLIVSGWMANMHALTHADADPLSTSLPHQLINLQSPLAILLGSRTLSSALALSLCGLLGLAYLWIDRFDPPAAPHLRARWLSALSAVTLLMLLVFYHRIYDAVFLLIPAAFALRQIAMGDRYGWALLAALVPLWIPLSSMVYRLLDLKGPIAANNWSQALIVQHQTWFLVAAFLLICRMRRQSTLGS